ncbi:MAG: class I adenylate-forming enzyme family protein [Pseudomonadota bacterium]
MLSVSQSEPFASCPAPFNLAAYVLGKADAQQHKIALEVLGSAETEEWSYGNLKAAVLGTGTGLLQAGLTPGDLLLMRLGNSVDFPIAYLGAISVGIIPVPTSSQLTEAEVAPMLDELSPKAVLRANGVACPDSARLVIDVPRLREMRDLPPAAFNMGDPNRLGYIVYTSGTAGKPRAVMHAHRAIWARRLMMKDWYGLTKNDRLMHAGAFNWTYTLGTGLMDPWTMGATALIAEDGTDLEELPLLLERHGATIFAAAPGVYRKLLSSKSQLTLPELRHGLAAGEKLSENLRRCWQDATGTQVHEAFGMSECSTFISASPDAPAVPESLGRAQAGRQLCIIGKDGPVDRGQLGTIAVHRDDPGLMLGYLNAEAETQARFQGEWFLSGDQGRMDADGNIFFLGRSDDMMNAGGYRVSPLEVEAALSKFPGIGQVAVTDIEVKADARVIMAFYTAQSPISEEALAAFTYENLAGYKRPRRYIRLDTLPTGPNGKLLRRALRPIYEALNGQT